MNFLNNIKTSKKLIWGFLILASMILIVSFIGYLGLQNLSGSMTNLYTKNAIPMEDLGNLKSELLTVRGDIFYLILDTSDIVAREKSLNADIDKANSMITDFKQYSLGTDEQAQFQIMEKNWQIYTTQVNQIAADMKSGDTKSAFNLLAPTAAGPIARTAMTEATDKLVGLMDVDAKNANLIGINIFNQFFIIMFAAAVLGLILAVIFSISINQSIIKPLLELTEALKLISCGDLGWKSHSKNFARKDEMGTLAKIYRDMMAYLEDMAKAAEMIASGDLTVQISPKSEKDVLGNAFSKMITNLNSTLQQTNAVTSQVVQAVEQVRSVSQDLASNSQEQSAAVEEVASSVEETDNQVKESSENANIANQLAGQTTALANVGQEKMKSLSGSMNSIQRSSQEISKIMRVIDDIAFQTNLLALNAAVEAARAGQYGKGFAVVAQEVRSLAERSAKAAKSTAELIEDSNRRVQEGVSMTDETAQSLNEIVNNIVKVKDLVGEIAAASDEQTRALNQISQAITQVSQGTQSNSSQSEELASTADELGSLADRLKIEVSRFKLQKNLNAATVGLPEGMTLEMLQAALANLNNLPAAKGKPDQGAGLKNVDRDERGYGEF